MLLDSQKLLNERERVVSLSEENAGPEDGAVSEDVLTSLARERHASFQWELPKNLPHSAQPRQAMLLKEQIDNAAITSTDNRRRDSDPLGTMLRSRSIPVTSTTADGESSERMNEKSGAESRP
jgi:hypothetical protein